MQWTLKEMDQDAEQLMNILKLKPFFHIMIGNTQMTYYLEFCMLYCCKLKCIEKDDTGIP